MSVLESAPGHVATLTLEEKKKLQAAWVKLGKICGIVSDTHGHDEDTDQTASSDDKYGQTKEFQAYLAEEKPENIRHALWSMSKMDNPDALITRFLRARKWNVDKAVVMLVSTVRWRKEIDLEGSVVAVGEAVGLKENPTADDEKFLDQYRSAKSFVRGTDKDGRALYIIRPRLHKTNAQPAEVMEKYILHATESVRIIVKDPYDTVCLIFDLSGFGMSNMDYTALKFIIKIFEANYPESLGVVCVHNAPWLFQGIWRMIKGWLDPVVAAKIRFTNNTKDLLEIIPTENLPKEYGGTDDFEYQYIEPVAGENDTMKDTETRDKIQAERDEIVKRFEVNTEKWVALDPESEEAKVLWQEREGLVKELDKSYWKLDPYIRSKTLFDRLGMIKPGGVLTLKGEKPVHVE